MGDRESGQAGVGGESSSAENAIVRSRVLVTNANHPDSDYIKFISYPVSKSTKGAQWPSDVPAQQVAIKPR